MIRWFTLLHTLFVLYRPVDTYSDHYICNESDPCTDHSISCGNYTNLTPYNYSCSFICNGTDSCARATIDCGYSTICHVACYGGDSCENAVIYGNYTNYLNWISFVPTFVANASSAGAKNASIYCPIPFDLRPLHLDMFDNKKNNSNYKSCEIQCPNSGLDRECGWMNIYSMEGFNHMLIDGPFNARFLRYTKIHCGEKYQHVCLYGMWLSFHFLSFVFFRQSFFFFFCNFLVQLCVECKLSSQQTNTNNFRLYCGIVRLWE